MLLVITAPAADKPPADRRALPEIEIVLGSPMIQIHGDVSASALRTVLDCLAMRR